MKEASEYVAAAADVQLSTVQEYPEYTISLSQALAAVQAALDEAEQDKVQALQRAELYRQNLLRAIRRSYPAAAAPQPARFSLATLCSWCRIRLLEPAEYDDALQAKLIRWAMEKKQYLSHHDMSDEELLTSQAPRIVAIRLDIDAVVDLAATHIYEKPTNEPPF